MRLQRSPEDRRLKNIVNSKNTRSKTKQKAILLLQKNKIVKLELKCMIIYNRILKKIYNYYSSNNCFSMSNEHIYKNTPKIYTCLSDIKMEISSELKESLLSSKKSKDNRQIQCIRAKMHRYRTKKRINIILEENEYINTCYKTLFQENENLCQILSIYQERLEK